MPPENAEFLHHFLTEAIPQNERTACTAEQLDTYILQIRIWAIREPEAFEQGVGKTIEYFFFPESDNIAIELMERYSLLQIAWITQEAARRLEGCDPFQGNCSS
jgi:hypothetical protein